MHSRELRAWGHNTFTHLKIMKITMAMMRGVAGVNYVKKLPIENEESGYTFPVTSGSTLFWKIIWLLKAQAPTPMNTTGPE